MMAFIEQEANEKAEEIDAKVCILTVIYVICYTIVCYTAMVSHWNKFILSCS